jgi:radical SAM protein with 4Fe4S-binding SPASM domain
MHVIRQSVTNWNKFGCYEAEHTHETNQIRKWQNVSLPGWTEPIISLSTVSNFDSQRKYKYSVFNIRKGFGDVDIIWNTASEGIVVLNQEERQCLDNFVISKNNINLELLRALFELGVLVFAEDEEFSKVHFIRKRSATNTENVKNFIILPTTQCNARCFYCFAHEDTKTNRKMTIQTADEVLQYIYSQVKPNDEVVFRWFGGEPLMAVDIIDYIIDNFNKHFQNTVKYYSIITSNISLLNDELILKAINKWNLRKIQIPLDGFQSEHDKRKNYYQKDKNQYQLLLSNVEKLLEKGIYTIIRLNLDHQNVRNLDNLLNDLEKFKDYNHFFFHTITLHTPANTNNLENYVRYSDFEEFYSYVYGQLTERGFLKNINRILPRRTMSVCTAMLNNFVLINADGNLFRCDQEVHNQENSVGNCKIGIIHNNNLLKWIDTDVEEECKKCEFLPVCQGGCKFYRFRNTSNLKPCVVYKYISNTLMNLVYKCHKEQVLYQ